MSEQRSMNGAEWLARALAGAGMTHVFFVESVLRRTLLQLKDLGVTPILAHSEKAAAYMADGYARVMRRPGVCMAQSVGAANLASGLQDPYLGHSPVIALTGRKEPSFQHRNAYQEIPHAPLFVLLMPVAAHEKRDIAMLPQTGLDPPQPLTVERAVDRLRHHADGRRFAKGQTARRGIRPKIELCDGSLDGMLEAMADIDGAVDDSRHGACRHARLASYHPERG